ncbi:MAG TPA: transcriptional regulator [Acidimicrobiia bacterium]|nr:transcriptional regulator [Acidimicrobiia bacterium]
MSETPYNEAVGRRLRSIRKQKGLSLQDVEANSELEFKASVLGAYERGERSLSLPRMQRLASFYGVPVDQLLPRDDLSAQASNHGIPTGGVSIDLNRLERDETTDVVERFMRAIQIMRQDFNGRVLTIRSSDLRLLAGLLHQSEESVVDVLTTLGVEGTA